MNDSILEGMLQLAQCGVMTTDENLVVNGWNNWLATKTGYSREQVVGKRLVDVFPDLVGRRLDAAYQQALGGQVVVLAQRLHEYLLRAPAAGESWAAPMKQSARIAPLLAGEQILGTLTVIDDVTERVEHDQELAIRARQQATIASLSQHALAGCELTTLMTMAAEAVADTLGAEQSAVWELSQNETELTLRAGTGWRSQPGEGFSLQASVDQSATGGSTFAPSGQTIRSLPALLAKGAFAAGDRIAELDAAISVRGRRFGQISVYSRRVPAFSGEDSRFLQTVADVVGMAIDRKRLEKELQERADDLAAADRRKDEFLAMLAHELRNPLAPVLHAIEFLQRHSSQNGDVKAAHNIIDQQVRQMARLVDDLLDVSRITRGRIALKLEELDLATVVKQAIENIRPIIESHQHALSVSLPAEPLKIRGDATRLAQAVANLLHNANKYTDKGGEITVALMRNDGQANISIKDNGIGIAAEALPHVFDLFMQVDNSLSRSQGGLGIGLTLVRNLIELHGGSVSAHSAGLRKGSEFTLRLPLADVAANSSAKAESPRESIDLSSRRLLVVDDNHDAANTLALLLRAAGHNVTVAYEGEQAIESAQIVEPEAIFLDIGLPGISGYDVARELRASALGESVKLVALTGYGQEEDRRQALEAGFDYHLVKPVTWDRLREVLLEALSA